jgi:spore cortex formation protein SpoVR/YcgB (stage V sporulation)
MEDKVTMQLAPTKEGEKYLNDLRILGERIFAVGKRYGLNPPPVNFTLKNDQQILDDIVYAGLPRHYRHWRYGKAAMQPRNGHVFEFALNSDPGEIALGSTNDIVMQVLVMIHAWMGHARLDFDNAWFRESQAKSIIQKFAHDERFVDALIAQWGHERYEYFMDAAHALEQHSGLLPSEKDVLPDSQHRRMLEASLVELEAAYRKASTDFDRKAIEDDIKDVVKTLNCHPLVPTNDILGFLANEESTPQLPWEAHHLMKMVRDEQRYHQAFMRTRYLHEGTSHDCDDRMIWEPEIDLLGLGFDKLVDVANYSTMHDNYPISWYHDVYAFGLHLKKHIGDLYNKYLGKEMVRFRRLKLGDDGHIIETDEWKEVEVDKWDRSKLHEIDRTYNDRRLFETFITEDSMQKLNKKALDWVRRMMAQVNLILREKGWDPSLTFDPLPDTLEDMYMVISIWMNQIEMSQQFRGWGFGAPTFPVHPMALQQMLQIIQTVASWDADKHAFKRQMIMYTDMSFLPDIRIVDSGRFSKAGMYTLRHEYDPDFGPLAQSDARETLRRFWRLAGPVQLLTWEILTDSFGRPVGPPRPYRYFTDNGITVKERWL